MAPETAPLGPRPRHSTAWFGPIGTGAKVTWTWDLFPRGAAGRLLVPVVARFWPGYARAALARLETLLVA